MEDIPQGHYPCTHVVHQPLDTCRASAALVQVDHERLTTKTVDTNCVVMWTTAEGEEATATDGAQLVVPGPDQVPSRFPKGLPLPRLGPPGLHLLSRSAVTGNKSQARSAHWTAGVSR